MKILAIETSCDETAAAVIEKTDDDIKILSNVVASQIEFHKQFGGVFPEHASRLHTEKIIEVVEKALKSEREELKANCAGEAHGQSRAEHLGPISSLGKSGPVSLRNSRERLLSNIDLITVTTGPGLIGSLLIGVNFAKTLAFATNKPIIGINHLLGHIYSNFVGEILNPKSQILNNNLKLKIENLKLPEFPILVLIVSGGHTGLYLMKSHNDIRTLGETLDDAAGEAFDKVAKLLGLGYPGGPAISAAAEKYKAEGIKYKGEKIRLPRIITVQLTIYWQ